MLTKYFVPPFSRWTGFSQSTYFFLLKKILSFDILYCIIGLENSKMTQEQANTIEALLLKMDERQLKMLKLQLSLGLLLKDEFKKEFQNIHLSKQLYHSIHVFAGDDGKVHVRIPAQMYDVNFYRKRGVIKHISQNSYAMAVNRTGGFSGMHKDYVSRCIYNAINKWKAENRIDIERINTSLRS